MSDLTAARDHALSMAGKSATSPQDAALWQQIADEIDAYLTPADDGPGLFGEGD